MINRKRCFEYLPWIFLGSFFTATLLLLWPGIMSPDAQVQYQAAVSAVYNDHHPPTMSLLWRYLDKIYPGSGLIFGLHLTMLYLAAAIFVYLFKDSKFRWWYVIYPLLPNILAYTALIVKDSGFAYAYLLAGAIIACMIVKRLNTYKFFILTVVLLLLFYGTAVKFQAKFLLLFFTIAIGYCLVNYKLNWRAIFIGIGLCIGILSSIAMLNHKLVPITQELHSWQYVKLYDLTAISLELNEPTYPTYILQDPDFNFTTIKQHFFVEAVDSLVFKNHLLQTTHNSQQLDELWNYWFTTVRKHPLLYLKVRFNLWSYNLTTAPSQHSDPVKFLVQTKLNAFVSQPLVAELISSTYNVLNAALKVIWLIPLLLLYTYLAITRFTVSRDAPPLLLFCCTSLMLLGVLLFFSMAATARYVFLCTCLIHASHGFAYRASRNI